jgi:hypothetical protein
MDTQQLCLPIYRIEPKIDDLRGTQAVVGSEVKHTEIAQARFTAPVDRGE